MKKIFFSAFFPLFFVCTTSIAQTIPNGSFERWQTVNNVQSPAGGWFTSDELNCTPLSAARTTLAADSTYALLLKTATCAGAGGVHEGYAIGFFPIASRPTCLTGMFKCLRVNADSAQIKIIMRKAGVTIGTTVWNIFNSTAVYTNFSVPIHYNNAQIPDEVQLYLFSDRIGAAVLNNELWVDKLAFENTTNTTNNRDVLSKAVVFPNPTTNHLNISTTALGAPYTLYNTLGVAIFSGIIRNEITYLSLDAQTEGVYFLKIGEDSAIKVVKADRQN